VTGLTNDLSYDFRVRAVNTFGTSSASGTATKTPGAPTAPDAPTIGTATAGNTQATVAFSAPADNGGSAITSYTVTSSPGGFTATGTSSPIIVTGLTNGTEYTFTVTATNAVGTSSASSVSNAITPSLLGNQLIDDFTGTTINTTKWLEIDPTGKGGLSGKVLQNGVLSIADSYSGGYWGATGLISQDSFSASSLEISAVMNTTSNPLIGYGDYIFAVPDTKAYLLYAQHGSTVLALSWDGTVSTQTSCGTATSGATFKMKIISGGFEVYKNGDLQCTHYTDVIINDKPIFLQNSLIASTFDNVVVYGTKTTAVTPGQVTGLSTVGMNKQVLLNWDAPTNNGYSAITDYLIEYKPSSSVSWSVFNDGISQNTKTIVTGLDNDIMYDFRVSAVNSAGNGIPSIVTFATPSSIDTIAFVITGESNSGGIGLNSAATAGEVAPRSSVQILELTSGNFLFENLDIGTNNLRDHAGLSGYYDTSHGFELGLANSVEAHAFPDNPQVYLVKTGQGGSQISQWAVGGTYWTKFLQRTLAAKTQLDEDRKWVVWMSLGINDAIAGTNLITWKNAMIAHINKIKDDLPGAIIILTQFQSMTNQSGYATYNAIMSDIASEEANVYVVDSTGAGLNDGNHWNYAGLKTVASGMVTITKDVLGLNLPGKITSLNATPSGSSVELSWTAPVSNGGSVITDYLIEYKKDTSSTWNTFSDGTSITTTTTVTGLNGSTDYNFRVSAVNSNGAGNTISVNTTTTDDDAPIISSVISTPSNTSVIITWTTDEASSSIVEYGLTSTYTTSTIEADTSPRVTSHSVTLDNLVACTTYNYRVKSNDASSNLATSNNYTFTTTGCTAGAEVIDENQGNIETATGGEIELLSGLYGIGLNIPAGATDTNAVFQIKQLNSSDVLVITSTPEQKSLVGNYTYELKSLSDIDQANTSFNEAITIILTYSDADVMGINEQTLLIYRYDGNTWNALQNCSVNTSLNTVTCTTTNFSVFGLFGNLLSVNTRRTTSSGTSLQHRINNLIAMGNITEAEKLQNQYGLKETIKSNIALKLERTYEKDFGVMM
jgi:trimeric autotransporter adhesin